MNEQVESMREEREKDAKNGKRGLGWRRRIERRMENGKQKTENRELKMENGE